MKKLSPEVEQELGMRMRLLEVALNSNPTVDNSMWTYLQDSESQLIELMTEGPPPPDAPGSIEFSWMLYFLNNSTYVPERIRTLLRLLGMPASAITTEEWNDWWKIWEGKGVCTGDGSWVDTATYAILDMNWSLGFINYLLVWLRVLPLEPFATTPAVVKIPSQPTLKIALFGDWGTGNYPDGNLTKSPSQQVMDQIAAIKPDIMIHLGDVYYSGTHAEEQLKLLDCWKAAPKGNFTLNSNHEMYDGGSGLYTIALKDSLFSMQKGTTYFAIDYDGWVIIGLDSAYNATSFYMDGAITDTDQPAFIRSLDLTGKKIMMLTHHDPMDVTGTKLNPFWDNMKRVLGGRLPDVWYWGHIHNGVVYSSQSVGGNVLCRCLGNAAIPIGDAAWLKNLPSVTYYTHTPLGDTAPNNALRVMNGFALVELSSSGIRETWFNQDGTVAWRR